MGVLSVMRFVICVFGCSAIMFGVTGWSTPGLARQAFLQSPSHPPKTRPKESSEDITDIIVNGVPPGPFPVTVDAPTTFIDKAEVSKQAASNAHFFSRCIKAADDAALRNLIDGPPNSPIRIAALDRIVRNHVACYPNFDPVALWQPGYYGDCNPRGAVELILSKRGQILGGDVKRHICQSFFDRGAIVERVLRMEVPDLDFTTEQLFAQEVRARLHAREDQFDKMRPTSERLYAKVVTCLVAFHPRLALAFPRTDPGSRVETKLRNALIGTSPQCVAGAQRVSVDSSQFRVYLADAIYSWALALKGTDSLIPAS